MTPEDQQAIDLVFAILEAGRRPGAQPATLFAIARRFLDARAAQERERCALTCDALGMRWQEEGVALRLDGLNAALACAAAIRALS